MSKIKITDVNKKDFEFSITDICDINGDSNSSTYTKLDDSEKDVTNKIVVKIVDELGNAVDLTKILDSKDGTSVMPTKIDVLFEATHSGQNHNYYNYHSDSMENDASSWMSPYAKPFIKNHDSHEEPLGRARSSSVGTSDFNPNRTAMNVTYRISDADAIAKFLDGRYSTMSIGGSVGHVTCGTCDKDILKDGVFKFCGHMKGETYDGQKCYWHGTDISYREGSVVNSPADDWAQVKQITVINPDGSPAKGADDENGELLGIIDSLTGVEETAEVKSAREIAEAKVIADKVIADKIIADKVIADKVIADKLIADAKAAQDIIDAKAIEDAKELALKNPKTLEDAKTYIDILLANVVTADELSKGIIDTKEAELVVANQCVKTLNESYTVATDNVKDLEAKIVIANEKIVSVTADSKDQRSTNIKLAVLNKKLMAQRIVDLELLSNLTTDEKKEARLTELIALGAKDLLTMTDSLVADTLKKVRKMATPVENPGKPNAKDSNSSEDDDIKDSKTKVTNIADYADDFVNSIVK